MLKIGVFFGGRSTEHEISILSAMNIIRGLNRDKYELLPVGVEKKRKFHFGVLTIKNALEIDETQFDEALKGLSLCSSLPEGINDKLSEYIDVAFPVFHGYMGEDGAMQGLLKTLDIPFVGPDIVGSAVCMDKDLTKKILKVSGIPVADGITVYSNEKVDYDVISQQLGEILFIKPANLGSSVGVHKVHNKEEFDSAVVDAFKFDKKILIEEAIQGREIECGVIGNEEPEVSDVCGEIVVKSEFYSYDAKYLDENGAALEVPAKIPEDISADIRNLALKAFRALSCDGMARVDFFLTKDNKIILNELNTIPGFTKISMFPMVWLNSGLTYSEIIDKLVDFAIERYQRDLKLVTSK